MQVELHDPRGSLCTANATIQLPVGLLDFELSVELLCQVWYMARPVDCYGHRINSGFITLR